MTTNDNQQKTGLSLTEIAAMEMCKQLYYRKDIHLSLTLAQEIVRCIEDAQRAEVEARGLAGAVYNKRDDEPRLSKQSVAIYKLMADGKWRTLSEIAQLLHYPESSISAQLRHLRKPRHGSHVVNKQCRGERSRGLFEYQLVINQNQ